MASSGRSQAPGLSSTLGICFGFAFFWLALEVACIAVRAPSFDAGETLRRLWRILPFHLSIFLGIGLALYALGRVKRLDRVGLGWWCLGCATWVFLGPRIALGAYRVGGHLPAAGAALLVGLLLALMIWGLTALQRPLPARLRAVWPYAAWVGWSVFWIAFVRRAGPALALRNPGEAGWLGLLDPAEFAIAALAGLLVLGLGALGARGTAAACVAFAWIAQAAIAPAARADDARPDVLIILVDTLRADDARETGGTPNLDALAAESVRFRRAHSPSNNTTRTLPNIFTSLPYEVVGQRIPASARTLTEILKDAGYATHGISANPWVSAQYGYDQGFDALYDAANAPNFLVSPLLQILGALAPGFSYHTGLVAADLYYTPVSDIRRRAVDILGRHDRPLLLYVHTMDVHGPYLPPKRHLDADYRGEDFFSYFPFIRLDQKPILRSEAFQPKIRNLRQRYRGEIRYTDEELGRLIQAYKDAGRWDETLVWFLSDHGECFGDHGYTGHTQSLFQALIHVPLLMKPPRSWQIAPVDVDEPVSTGDLLPTIAALLGLPPPEPAFGADLASLVRGEGPRPNPYVISSSVGPIYSAIRGPWKLHLDMTERTRRLFHLESDPGEVTDLSQRRPDVAAELEAAIAAHVEREEQVGRPETPTEIDAETRRRLESLGYVE